MWPQNPTLPRLRRKHPENAYATTSNRRLILCRVPPDGAANKLALVHVEAARHGRVKAPLHTAPEAARETAPLAFYAHRDQARI